MTILFEMLKIAGGVSMGLKENWIKYKSTGGKALIKRLRTYFCYILMCLSTFCTKRKWVKASTFFFRRSVDLMDQEQTAHFLKELLITQCRLMVKYPHLMDEYMDKENKDD